MSDGNTEDHRYIVVTQDTTIQAYFESTTQGISTADVSEITLYATDGRIVLHGADGLEMSVFDMVGREVFHAGSISGETPALPAGVYLVKVGTLPARKVVVVR